MIEFLIENKGVTQTKNNDGYSVEELAIKYGYREIAEKISQGLKESKTSNLEKSPGSGISQAKVVLHPQNERFDIKSTAVAA